MILGALGRLAAGLARTRSALADRLKSFLPGRALDETLLLELEETLLAADLGVKATESVLADLRKAVLDGKARDAGAVPALLKDAILKRLAGSPRDLARAPSAPTVWMVAGVNGCGKTTSIAKLAHRETSAGRKVILGAADTFRAAASEQLALWAERIGCGIVKHGQGADPGAVAFDACQAARARGMDLLILDTAGRLHTDRNLLAEIQKVQRVAGKAVPGAPHETLLVLDATSGQNALAQAKAFREGLNVTGIVLTKLDGTAKGGIVLAIQHELGLPVRFVGVGEGMEDLEPFDPEAFAEALLGRQSDPGARG